MSVGVPCRHWTGLTDVLSVSFCHCYCTSYWVMAASSLFLRKQWSTQDWNASQLKKFWPMSNVLFLSRLPDRVVHVRLQAFLDINHPSQLHSTQTVMLNVHTDLLLAATSVYVVVWFDHDLVLPTVLVAASWPGVGVCQKFSFRSCFGRQLLASGQDRQQTLHTCYFWQAASAGVQSVLTQRRNFWLERLTE